MNALVELGASPAVVLPQLIVRALWSQSSSEPAGVIAVPQAAVRPGSADAAAARTYEWCYLPLYSMHGRCDAKKTGMSGG
jgi:hypothetical protein